MGICHQERKVAIYPWDIKMSAKTNISELNISLSRGLLAVDNMIIDPLEKI